MILIKQENKWYLTLNKLRPCDQKMIPSRDDTWMESGNMNENTEYNYLNDRCPSHAIEAHTQSRVHILNNRCHPRYSSLWVWQRNSHSKRDFYKNTNEIKSYQSSKVYPSAITLKKTWKTCLLFWFWASTSKFMIYKLSLLWNRWSLEKKYHYSQPFIYIITQPNPTQLNLVECGRLWPNQISWPTCSPVGFWRRVESKWTDILWLIIIAEGVYT